MTIQQLEYLVAIAQSSSISQAAQKLYISQSSVSKSIKQLESELGFDLMERDYKGIVFTPKGEEFLREAYSLVEKFHLMEEHYSSPESETVRYTVSSQHYIFVVEAVSRLLAEAGDHYTLGLREHRTSRIIRDVSSRSSQIGFIYYYSFNHDFLRRELQKNDLEFHHFCTLKPHIYCSMDHPLATREYVTQEQLKNYPYVCYDLGTDAVEYAEEILSPLHGSRVIQVLDRASLCKIMTHSNAYSLGSGLLRDGFIESQLATVPIKTPIDTDMHVGWIAPKGNVPLPGSMGDRLLEYCRESLASCFTGHPLKNRIPVVCK